MAYSLLFFQNMNLNININMNKNILKSCSCYSGYR